MRYADALHEISHNPSQVAGVGPRIASEVARCDALLESLVGDGASLELQLAKVVEHTHADEDTREAILGFLTTLVNECGAVSLHELLAAISASVDRGEQELVEGAANILTMHKAKGLSADSVFIVGAEDEFIPGRNEGELEGDERRLLFVSMTRARHHLFMTFCQKRVGQQMHLGRTSGRRGRSLTRFLIDAPIRVEDGRYLVL